MLDLTKLHEGDKLLIVKPIFFDISMYGKCPNHWGNFDVGTLVEYQCPSGMFKDHLAFVEGDLVAHISCFAVPERLVLDLATGDFSMGSL